jgi:hypothetical protein
MKGSKFLYLLVAAALIGGLALLMKSRDEVSWQEATIEAGTKLLGDLAVNDVASVRLLGTEGRVTAKRVNDTWVIEERENYPADFAKISALVRKVAELEPVQTVPLGEGDAAALVLKVPTGGAPDAETGTLVELSDASGKKLAALVAGKTHSTTSPNAGPMGMAGDMVTGRYLLLADASGTAYLVTETFSDLQTSPAQWIDKNFVRPGPPKRIEVKAEGKDRNWTIERDAPGAAWKLAGAAKNENLDPTKVLNIDALVTGLAVADVPDAADDARLKPLTEKPVVVTIDSFEGLRFALKFGEGNGDNLPAEISVEVTGDPAPAPAAAAAEGQKPEEAAAQAMEAAKKARDEKVAQAAKLQGKQVFIPRNFLEPFVGPRGFLLAAPAQPAPTPAPTPRKKR